MINVRCAEWNLACVCAQHKKKNTFLAVVFKGKKKIISNNLLRIQSFFFVQVSTPI